MSSNDIIGAEYEGEVSSATSSKRARRSAAWNSFDKFIDDEGLPRVKCRKCPKVFMAKDDGGTSNMMRHILTCPATICDVPHPPINQEKYREKMSEVIIKHGYPFSFVEHEGIRELHSFLNPRAKTITRNTAKLDVINMYRKHKENLKCYLRSIPGKFCLTSDLWSSITTDQYMVLTAYYITKDWVLEKKILAFFHMPPPHTGANLAEKLLSLLKEWGIDQKVFTITLDNASQNDKMVKTLQKDSSFGLVANGNYFHVRCGAHILNLIVQDGLKVIEGSLNKIRESVKYVRGSETRKIKFLTCLEMSSSVTSKQLRQDVPTRWNSTYLMIERAICFREAFTHLLSEDPSYGICFSEEEWVELEKLREFLKPFYDITTLFSGSTYPTANLFFYGVWKIQLQLKETACAFHDDFETANRFCCMARRMKKKFDKYWISYSVILSFAVILDPRYKLQFVEYSYVMLYGADDGLRLAKNLHEKLKDFFQEYIMSSSINDENPSSSRTHRGSPTITSSHVLEDFGRYQSKLFASSRVESDLESYLLHPRMDHKEYADLNVLEFWKTNEGKYPKLSVMARDILSIPITTVASESAFSIGGRILDKYRSSLLPENVEALICTNDWLNGIPATLNLDDDELVEDLGAQSTFTNDE